MDRVRIEPDQATLDVFGSLQLTAACLDATGAALSGLPIEWASDASSARVSAEGVVWGASAGAATISASCGGKTATAAITVVDPDMPTVDAGLPDGGRGDSGAPDAGGPTRAPVASVSVTPTTASVLAGGTVQLKAELRDASGSALVDARTISFSSSSPNVARVDARGLVIGVGPGMTTITVTSEGKSASVTITGHAAVAGTVTAGALHTCALTRFGRAYCCGSGLMGALGIGALPNSVIGPVGAPPPPGEAPEIQASPTLVAGDLLFRTLSAGYYHTCGITIAGDAYCWGGGYLGNGAPAAPKDASGLPTATSLVPVRVAGGLKFESISAGAEHTCALTAQGEAYCWGVNHGLLGLGTDTEAETVPMKVVGGLTFKSISAGVSSTLALTPAGIAYQWGRTLWLPLPVDPQAPPQAQQAAVLAPAPVPGGHTFTQISDDGHALALKSDGTAYAWGASNAHGVLGTTELYDDVPIATPTPVLTTLRFRSIHAGKGISLGISTEGELTWWGLFRVDGTLDGVFNGTDRTRTYYTPYTFGDYDLGTIAGGEQFAIGLDANGVMVGLGSNSSGQLCTGSATVTHESVTSPVATFELLSLGGEWNLKPGDTLALPVNVVRRGGFTLDGIGYSKPITLEVISGGSLMASIDPAVLPAGQTAATLQITVPKDAPDASGGVGVQATSPNSETTSSSEVPLTVTKPLPAGSTLDMDCDRTPVLKPVEGSVNLYHCMQAKPGVNAPGQYAGDFNAGDRLITRLTKNVWVDRGVGVCIHWGRDWNGRRAPSAYVRAQNGGNSGAEPKNGDVGRWGVLVKRSGIPEGGTQWLVFTDKADPQIRGLMVEMSGAKPHILGWQFEEVDTCPF